MKNSEKTSRRNFIKLATVGTIITGTSKTILGSGKNQDQAQKVSPNEKIRLATIGIGGQGTGDTTTALRVPGVELVAAADVYDGRLTRAKEVFGNQVFTTRDYREVLARPDVDAVIIATPDHWHTQISIDAMNAGKDVYCEKPMVHSLDEGSRIIEAQRKTKRIYQVGSQRVSSVVYQKAKELIGAGAIGELNLVEAWWNRN
ncbi:MAG TPA: Gfo/Idh/MocA family oxidoreductase, partial [Blastocatellia bacterium]